MICDRPAPYGHKTFTVIKIELVGEQRDERKNQKMKYKKRTEMR